MKSFLGVLAGLAVVVLVLAIPYGVASVSCDMAWKDSGLQSRYRLFRGCQVSLTEGKTWIPDDRYRVTE